VGELELGQIEEIVRICLLCDLSISRTHAVPGEGSPKSRIFLIGEAPGREEDRLGRPFVGRAGQILDRLLLSIKLDRADTYITSVVKCRPPNNREPTMKEELICNRYLARQLELIDPDVIVPMGRHAISCLFDMFGPAGLFIIVLDLVIGHRSMSTGLGPNLHGLSVTIGTVIRADP
jgi:uracil-DNA glycosylase family 4